MSDRAVARWRRERALAHPARQAQYSREKAARRYVRFLRTRWVFCAVTAAIPIVCSLPAVYVTDGLARGLVVGAAITAGLGFSGGFALLASGVGMQIMGTLGEGFTAQDLKPLRRRGWKVIHGLRMVDGCDIDHVAIGPSGVLAIETKWSADEWPLRWSGGRVMDGRMDRARRQALKSSRAVREVLRQASIDCTVTPVAVLWSPELVDSLRPDDDLDRPVMGVETVLGRDFRKWLSSRNGDVLATEEIARVWDTLERHAHESEEGVEPRPTIEQLLLRWVVAPMVGFGAVLFGFGAVATTSGNFWVDVGALVLATFMGVVGHRRPSSRGLATGWLFACALMVLIVVYAVVAVAI